MLRYILYKHLGVTQFTITFVNKNFDTTMFLSLITD